MGAPMNLEETDAARVVGGGIQFALTTGDFEGPFLQFVRKYLANNGRGLFRAESLDRGGKAQASGLFLRDGSFWQADHITY